MAVSDAHVFPSFLTPVLTQLSFQSQRLLFPHASAEVRQSKIHQNRTHNHQVMSPTPSPLSHTGRAIKLVNTDTGNQQQLLPFPQCFQKPSFPQGH